PARFAEVYPCPNPLASAPAPAASPHARPLRPGNCAAGPRLRIRCRLYCTDWRFDRDFPRLTASPLLPAGTGDADGPVQTRASRHPNYAEDPPAPRSLQTETAPRAAVAGNAT